MSKPEPIPLKMLRCSEVVDAPGIGVAHGVTAGPRHKLEYWPWLRHHRLEYLHDATKPPIVSYIPEDKVSFWQPLEPVPVPASLSAPPARTK